MPNCPSELSPNAYNLPGIGVVPNVVPNVSEAITIPYVLPKDIAAISNPAKKAVSCGVETHPSHTVVVEVEHSPSIQLETIFTAVFPITGKSDPTKTARFE